MGTIDTFEICLPFVFLFLTEAILTVMMLFKLGRIFGVIVFSYFFLVFNNYPLFFQNYFLAGVVVEGMVMIMFYWFELNQ